VRAMASTALILAFSQREKEQEYATTNTVFV